MLQGHYVPYRKDLESPGDFTFWHMSEDGTSGYLAFKCPCGCNGRNSSLPSDKTKDSCEIIRIGKDFKPDSPGWQWDGNVQHPTLTPSIWSKTDYGGCGWHGFLQGGIWKSV